MYSPQGIVDEGLISELRFWNFFLQQIIVVAEME